ncbi:MAG: hypothetical protein ABJA57_12310 [Ginsengibacter sp.]
MKKINQYILVSLTVLLICGSSCKKDPGKLPDISFISDTGYTSSDAALGKNEPFKIGINAAKTEEEDILKTFNISVSYDGGPSESILSQTLATSQGDNYTYDLVKSTRNQAGIEKYSFTITNRDGLVNTVSLTLTVH